MSGNVKVEAALDDPLTMVANALETAVLAAKDGVSEAQASVEKAMPVATRLLARIVYGAGYTVSYGVVVPTLLIAKVIPTNNALVNGFIDGARAARDTVSQM
jgi:hypothetical protein